MNTSYVTFLYVTSLYLSFIEFLSESVFEEFCTLQSTSHIIHG